MPLGMEVGLACKMGTQLPLKRGGQQPPPPLSAHVLWPNGWMDQDASWYIVLDGSRNSSFVQHI